MSLFRFLFALSCASILLACGGSEKRDESRIPYLEVDGRYLYVDDIQSVIPVGSTKADSISVANNYIRKWVTEVLLYKHANSNISNQDEIDMLVEDYRKSLIIHQYQQNLIRERLADVLTEDQMQKFYAANKDKFILNNCIIKGLYIQVPLGAPKYANLQNWLRNFNKTSIENVEKYSVQNATSYEYFGDKWAIFNEVVKNIPIKIEDQAGFITRNKYIEVQDNKYHYILRILDYKLTGGVEPYDEAKEKIKTILMNKEKIDYMLGLENKLYKDAVKDKDITYFKNGK